MMTYVRVLVVSLMFSFVLFLFPAISRADFSISFRCKAVNAEENTIIKGVLYPERDLSRNQWPVTGSISVVGLPDIEDTDEVRSQGKRTIILDRELMYIPVKGVLSNGAGFNSMRVKLSFDLAGGGDMPGQYELDLDLMSDWDSEIFLPSETSGLGFARSIKKALGWLRSVQLNCLDDVGT